MILITIYQPDKSCNVIMENIIQFYRTQKETGLKEKDTKFTE